MYTFVQLKHTYPRSGIIDRSRRHQDQICAGVLRLIKRIRRLGGSFIRVERAVHKGRTKLSAPPMLIAHEVTENRDGIQVRTCDVKDGIGRLIVEVPADTFSVSDREGQVILLCQKGNPKFLRRYFQYDRKLLSDLSRCGWKSL